jgi:MSHA biogenesis protein MshN
VSEAAGTLRDGLQLMPRATPLAKLYARILVDQGDVPIAVIVLQRARPAVSADPEYHALLAELYRQEKKHGQAAQVYQQVLMQRPGVASWWMGLALSQDAMGENAQALQAFQRAQRAGGLAGEVMQYVQTRIVALKLVATPVTPASVAENHDFDEFGE